MLESEVVQKKEEMRQEWREKLNVHDREASERRQRLEKEKKTKQKIGDQYHQSMVDKHRDTLEETRNHSEQLLEIERKQMEETIRYEKKLLEISKMKIAVKLGVADFRTQILEKYHRTQDNHRKQRIVNSVRNEKMNIEKGIKRLKLGATNKVPELIEVQIQVLKPALICFELGVQDLIAFRDQSVNNVKKVSEALYILEDIHNEFQMDTTKDLTSEIDKLLSVWNTI